MDQIMIRRIQMRLDALGINATQAATRAGLHKGYITELMNPNRMSPDGKKIRETSPRISTLQKIANALDCDVEYLTGRQAVVKGVFKSPLYSAPVVGEVRAGHWFESEYLGAAIDDESPVPVLDEPLFPADDQVAFKVVGDSINEYCPDGGYAVAVPLEKCRIDIRGGLFVIAERERGGLYETTIKQLDQMNGSWRLLPRSTAKDSDGNPLYRPIIFPSISEDEEVRIVAVVIRFIGPTLI